MLQDLGDIYRILKRCCVGKKCAVGGTPDFGVRHIKNAESHRRTAPYSTIQEADKRKAMSLDPFWRVILWKADNEGEKFSGIISRSIRESPVPVPWPDRRG